MTPADLRELAEGLSEATGEDLFDWIGLPRWAAIGGEHYDGGWVPDCGQKTDFDPGLLRLSCRVWGDGTYACSVYFGADYEIEDTGILRAPSKTQAKALVEQWCTDRARDYGAIITAALRARADHIQSEANS